MPENRLGIFTQEKTILGKWVGRGGNIRDEFPI
jgi:hypothetical protein